MTHEAYRMSKEDWSTVHTHKGFSGRIVIDSEEVRHLIEGLKKVEVF